MNGALLGSWKTSAAGILAGLFVIVHAAYQPGMTPKQWAVAAGHAIVTAAIGVLAQDHKTP